MRTFCSLDEIGGALDGCAVAIGNFDGVHLGHHRLLDTARRLAASRGAPAVALTFRPHPAKVLSKDLAPPLLATAARKRLLLEETGLDAAVFAPFDRGYAATTAEEFALRDLAGKLGARDVVVGPDFTFGKGRAGSAALLAQLLGEKAEVHVVAAVTVDELVVSSTKIRELVLTGRVAAAARLLGRPFVLDGTVVRGQGRGRTLGIPTANVAPETEVRPASGVYAVVAASAALGGRVVGGAANIGRKPTFGASEVTVEVHLFDVDADLYGAPLSVAFLERLRGEEKFSGPEALVAQIRKDIEDARAIAGSTPPHPLVVAEGPGPCPADENR